MRAVIPHRLVVYLHILVGIWHGHSHSAVCSSFANHRQRSDEHWPSRKQGVRTPSAYSPDPQHALPHPVIRLRPRALEPEAALARVGLVDADDGERNLAQHRQVLRRIVLGRSACAVAEADVEDQMGPVLHAPIRIHRWGQLRGREGTRADVATPLEFGLLVANNPEVAGDARSGP